MASPNEPAKPSAPDDLEPLLTDLLGKDIVTVIVGGYFPQEYRLHKKLLCHHSTFFDAAFNGAFQEGISGQLKLPEENAGSFDIFVHWLYSGSLPRGYTKHNSSYIHVYAMAEKWFIPSLQDAICDQMREWWTMDRFPSELLLTTLYKVTSPGCNLRRYFVKNFIVNGLRRENKEHVDISLEQNGELAIDVAKEMFLRLRISTESGCAFQHPERLPRCEFHVHSPGIDCRRQRISESMVSRFKRIEGS